jgi:mRNA interferase MazF
MHSSGVPSPKRGEIWMVNFDPQVGQEIRKLRPAFVLSLDVIGRLPLRIVAPITEWDERYRTCPWFVRLKPTAGNGLTKESGVDGFQVKSVSVQRFNRRIGHVPKETCEEIAAAVALCIGVAHAQSAATVREETP